MNSEILKTLKRGFPQNLIKKRKGLGGNYDFVTGNSVQDRLDEAFQGDWSWEVSSESGYTIGEEWVTVVGVMTVHLVGGGIVRKSGEGAVQIKKSHQGKILDLGFDMSAASTKALKKAATRLGIAREIEVAEPDDEGSDPISQPPINQSNTIPTNKEKVFPNEDMPTTTKLDTSESTPVQIEAIKNRVGTMNINMQEAFRKGLNRKDVPDRPNGLTREEAKKVLITLNS